jgi:hypothetical protein
MEEGGARTPIWGLHRLTLTGGPTVFNPGRLDLPPMLSLANAAPLHGDITDGLPLRRLAAIGNVSTRPTSWVTSR